MPLATAPFDSPARAGDIITLTVPSGLAFFAGTMAAFNTSTNAVVRADNVANVKAVGVVEKDAVAGEPLIINRTGLRAMKNSATSPLAAADFGDVCFIEDDTTVAKAASNSARAGVVMGVFTEAGQSYVWVDFSNNF